MANRVVCTEQTNCSHSGHILAVGIGANATKATDRMTVAQVWAAIDRGQRFYTQDTRGNVATVHKFNCPCGSGSLRTGADASSGNNLDNMRLCSWS